ncbi:MAG: zf-TFIIB domain-containing protein [Burkholderiaceae bacterium]|nr:zf-TFIIB domain-containing protein [Burkholderiaceae bacterium]
MDCPVCKTDRPVMTERQGIEIDYCPKCRGVWLDRGELDKIVERSSAELAAARAGGRMDEPAPGDHDRRRGDHSYRGHYRRSIWKELFD